ncbi:hypothetical protein AOL_s00007g139 [Orbilia oligospora ATCC 24927]|uniref:N-acetyltransferase domain-containing protein n=1 Tax=Arthrobotrys oligospora (strain ATCC 24927 / CBS 115.81 / DSM 1491) TaxID=756982 RepID=G1X1I0_ARTOA|nr:hypothetical protein AOL_s00007g139 [Orbilia oligospora ATCC 24927]EGX52803.1 hypothetical protein AOL_s00007g139 [Orbilia oligospora ATCC 24927]
MKEKEATTLRPTTPTDLPTILEIHRHSLPLHTHALFTNPFRHLHPTSYALFTLVSPTNKLSTPPSPHSQSLTITTTSSKDTPTSWAFWRRSTGPLHSSKIQQYKTTASSIASGQTPISSLAKKEEAIKYKSLSLPRSSLCNLHTLRDTLKYFTSEHYYLSHLLVHPDHKRKGFGTILTLWGLYHAAKEGLPVFLTASTEGEGLYKKLGFRVIGEKSFPSIEELSEEDREREEEVLGKEVVEEQFRIVEKPKIMVWEGTVEDEIFKDEEVMRMILAVPWDIQEV